MKQVNCLIESETFGSYTKKIFNMEKGWQNQVREWVAAEKEEMSGYDLEPKLVLKMYLSKGKGYYFDPTPDKVIKIS